MLNIFFVLLALATLTFFCIFTVVFVCERFLIGGDMGVEYRQYCMIGVSFDWSELKTVIAPAEYKLENRYDTKTGKVTHQEKILVKEEESCYMLCGRTFKYIGDIRLDGLWTEINYEDECLYIGLPVTEPEDLGRVTLLEDYLDLLNLEKLQDRVKDILPQYSYRIGMHLFYIVR